MSRRREGAHSPVLVEELLSLFSESSTSPISIPAMPTKSPKQNCGTLRASPLNMSASSQSVKSTSGSPSVSVPSSASLSIPRLISAPTRLLDCTFGRGGHSLAFLKKFPDLQITALDCDHQAVEYGSSLKEVHEGRIRLIKTNFFHFPELFHQQSLGQKDKLEPNESIRPTDQHSSQQQSKKLEPKNLRDTQLNQQSKKLESKNLTDTQLNQHREKFDLILMDLGPSSPQLDEAERGFSFQESGPLDMRMDRDKPLRAEEIINHWSEKELIRLFQLYGEIRRPQKVVANIVQQRRKKPITDTLQLSRLIQKGTNKRNRHPSTLWFLALRIAVNQELKGLKACLPNFLPLLNRGGCLAIISFHSLEDRIVKKAFAQLAAAQKSSRHLKTALWSILTDKSLPSSSSLKTKPHVWTKKAIRPSLKERKQNPRSRSAKLRIFQKAL